MRVLVVGGMRDFVLRSFAPKLAKHGIEVPWHWGWDSKGSENLPRGCEGVLILKDTVSHELSNSVLTLARENDIPWGSISHKFSVARRQLLDQGFLNKTRKDPVQDGTSDDGREIADMKPTKIEETVSVTHAQILDWASMLLEDRPERTLDDLVRSFKDDLEGTLPPDEVLFEIAEKAKNFFIEKWSRLPQEMSKDEVNWIKEAKALWVERMIQSCLDQGIPLLKYKEIIQLSRSVFGRGVHGSLIKEVRDKLGIIDDRRKKDPPAKSLLPVVPAWLSKGRYSREGIMKSVEEGRNFLKGLDSKTRESLTLWVTRVDQDRLAKPPDVVVKALESLDGRCLMFATVILLSLPDDVQVIAAHPRTCYRNLFAKNLGPYVPEAIAYELNISFRQGRPDPEVKAPEVPNDLVKSKVRSLSAKIANLSRQVKDLRRNLEEKNKEIEGLKTSLGDNQETPSESHVEIMRGIEQILKNQMSVQENRNLDVSTIEEIREAVKKAPVVIHKTSDDGIGAVNEVLNSVREVVREEIRSTLAGSPMTIRELLGMGVSVTIRNG